MTVSKTGTKRQTTKSGSGYKRTSYGTVWGNGSMTPVLGYVIKNGSQTDNIETAQIRK